MVQQLAGEFHISMIELQQCPICLRFVEENCIESHHYIPACEKGTIKDTIRICGTCHDVIHHYIPITKVKNYITVSDITSVPALQPYLKWIRGKRHIRNWKLCYILRKLKKGSF